MKGGTHDQYQRPPTHRLSPRLLAGKRRHDLRSIAAVDVGAGQQRPRARQERWDEAMAALREQLREGVPRCWQEVRAVETVLEEVAEEFGEDPLLPPVRQVLDKTRQDLAELHVLLEFVDAEIDLPEPDQERVEFLRQRWLRQDT